MEKNIELFEFLCELVSVQIKKYVELASRGVGPDARLNAELVYKEVGELLEITKSFLSRIKLNSLNEIMFNEVFQQVKFYIEQEKRRGYAGWLLTDIKIHSTVYERTKEQYNQLGEIAKLAEIDFSHESKPLTPIQCQCEHDSYQIAQYILQLARDVTMNPEMEFDSKIPKHAQPILRKNAKDRYIVFAKEIDTLYDECTDFLNNSSLTPSSTQLTKEDAESFAKIHNEKMDMLLQEYKHIKPNSRLFSKEYVGHEVGRAEESQKPSSVCSSRSLFFNGMVVTGVLTISCLLPYFINSLNEDLSSTMTLD